MVENYKVNAEDFKKLNIELNKVLVTILQEIYRYSKGMVYQGPFEGMKIVPEFVMGAGLGNTSSKLLGLYENELYDAVEQAIQSDPDMMINVGCAEGFYGIGFAIRCPDTPVVLIDINDRAIKVVEQNAAANGVKNYQVGKDSSPAHIESLIKDKKNPFLVVDIEGAERELLNLAAVPSLARATILVECHDLDMAGTTELLIKNLTPTHHIENISQGAKNPYLDITRHLPDLHKMLASMEGRSATMNWLHATPKK